MDEESAVIAWAAGLLKADASIISLTGPKVYRSQAPQGTTGNFIILQSQDYREIGTARDGTLGAGTMLLLVKAVTQSSGFASAAAIRKAAHLALHQKTGVGDGVRIASCIRENQVGFVEDREGGARYNHLGAIYRLVVCYL